MRTFLAAGLTMVLWGISPLFDKLALGRIPPFLAVVLRSSVITACLVAALVASGQTATVGKVNGRAFGFLAAGALSAGLLGQITYYYALRQGRASTVVPLIASYPLVTVALSTLLLREHVTWIRGLGAMAVVTGIILLRH